MAMNLTIHPDRDKAAFSGTGIYIRAKHHSTGRYDTYDILQLDAESLLVWLRSRGGNNPWAEDTVGLLLGHGHLHNKTDVERLAECGDDSTLPDCYQVVREKRPDIYREIVEVGLCVTCSNKTDAAKGSAAENRAMEIVAKLLTEHEEGS